MTGTKYTDNGEHTRGRQTTVKHQSSKNIQEQIHVKRTGGPDASIVMRKETESPDFVHLLQPLVYLPVRKVKLGKRGRIEQDVPTSDFA